MKLYLTVVIYLCFSFTISASSDLDLFNRQIKSFCGIKSSRELKRVKIDLTYYSCTDKESGEEVPILDFAKKMERFMKIEAPKKSLMRICKSEYRDVWKEKGYIAKSLSTELPTGECICDLMKNGFESTKKAICPTEENNPIKDLINDSLNKAIGVNAIQMEKEVKFLNDQAKYYGVENMCPEFKDISCGEGFGSHLKALTNNGVMSDERFEFLSGKYKSPKDYLSGVSPKDGKFYRPKLEIKSQNLKAKYIKMSGAEIKASSSSELNSLIGRKSTAHHVGEMYDLRKNIQDAGNSIEKYLVSSGAVKAEGLNEALKSFCQFNPEKDSEKLLEIKEKIFTHDAISFKSCGDRDHKAGVEANSKQLISLLNKSSKNLKDKPFLADAIEEDLRKEFLKDMPRRCDVIKKRAELICQLPTKNPSELLDHANFVENLVDSKKTYLELIGSQDAAKANSRNELINSLSCFLGKSPGNIRTQNSPRSSIGIPPIESQSTSSEVNRTVAQQVAEHERELGELLIAAKIAKEVKDVKDQTPQETRDSSQAYHDFITESNERVRNVVGAKDARGLDVSKSDFFDRIEDLRTQEHKRFKNSMLDIQRLLVKERAKVTRRLKDGNLSDHERSRLESRLSSINTQIGQTENLTDTKVASYEGYNFGVNSSSASVNEIPKNYVQAKSADNNHSDVLRKLANASTNFNPIVEPQRSELTLPTDISGKAKQNIHRRQNGGFAPETNKSSGRSPSSIGSSGGGTSSGGFSSGGSALASSVVDDVGIYQVPDEQQEARVVETKEDELRQKVTFVEEKKVMRVYERDDKGKYSLKGEYDRNKFKTSRENFIDEVHHKAMVFFDISMQEMIDTELQ